MYVCVCLAVTDRQVRAAIEGGACTRRALVRDLGVGRVCGRCNDEVKAMLGCDRASACCNIPPPGTASWPMRREPIYSIPAENTP